MQTTTEKVNRISIFAENVVSQLQQAITLMQESLQGIESYIAELNSDAERERLKIKEMEIAKIYLLQFGKSD